MCFIIIKKEKNMSEDKATESLVEQIGRLNAESAKRRVKAREFKNERDEIRLERDELKKQVDELARERDLYRQKLESDPEELRRDVERLRSELRDRDHKDTFQKVATKAGVRPEAIDDLWRLSGYKAETDEPNVEQMTELVESAKSARSYLFQQPADAGKGDDARRQGEAHPVRAPGPGMSRGVPDPSAGGITVRRGQLRDPNWMRVHQGAVAEASKKGLLTILPD